MRSRQYLVQEVVPSPAPGEQSLVRLACLDDDAQGVPLDVLWEKELDAEVLGEADWSRVAARGFDSPQLFSAYLHTLRWSCVTSTNPRLFQAPWRAGIEVMAYQLEPLRKALLLPRVNLFIADDVGLGKTIEAALILRELILRQKVRRVVVACPPSVLLQWQSELESRFGLSFVIFDRDFMLSKRRERGFAVNPWNTHTRFILSHALLRDETYAAPLRDWLGDFAPGSLLILDEAHNAAPASGARYAIDSQLTRAVRDIAPRFEHRLFLSATPHNGHSNSFAALLEILDPQRFCRGVPVKGRKLLDAVMVRRLKSDLRGRVSGIPERRVIQIDLEGLPDDAPELRLSELLAEYAEAREARLEGASKQARAAAGLVIVSLQKRLLSSVEAFAATLRVHRRALVRLANQEAASAGPKAVEPALERSQLSLLRETPGPDDERSERPEDEVRQEEEAALEAATSATRGAPLAKELALLDEMTRIAEAARALPDAKVKRLIVWIRANPEKRALVFTEYTDTKRLLEQQLQSAFASEPGVEERFRSFDGHTDAETREEVKRLFNASPSKNPLRVLIATDAAREGVNLQNHCADLFHFDVPWNPSRMEQRNGRIDRKLQRSPEVRCHYFVYRQRTEDRVLEALVRKTRLIEQELGSLSPVLERRLTTLLEGGIRRADAARLVTQIEGTEADAAERAVVEEELEAARDRAAGVERQIETLQTQLEEARTTLGLEEVHFRGALCSALEILGAEALAPAERPDPKTGAVTRWRFPALDRRAGADPSWAEALDSLRPPRKKGEKPWDWRRDAPVRPVVFADPGTIDEEVVHLHLEQRVVQRLLGRFRAQGFIHHDLSRACVGQTRDAIPRVALLGRLSLYGTGAARLHDEVVAVAARWTDPTSRNGALAPYAEGARENALDLLEAALAGPGARAVPAPMQERLRASVTTDVLELLPHLEARCVAAVERAKKLLLQRGEREARDMREILEAQRTRIARTAGEYERPQLSLGFDLEEQRQLEANQRHWSKRLAALEDEMAREPARIAALYAVKAVRIEPVGLVYLWPVSG